MKNTKSKGGGGKAQNAARTDTNREESPKRNRRAKRPHNPGSIRQVRLRLWWAIIEAGELLDEPETDVKLRAISALSTAAGAYGNLVKTHAMETEVAALQKDLHELKQTLSRPASGTNRSTAPTVN